MEATFGPAMKLQTLQLLQDLCDNKLIESEYDDFDKIIKLMPTKIEIAKLLINAKADLNKQDFEGKSALHWAVERHNVDVVKSFFSK
jgi:ankyrin repeat protein